MVGVRVEGRVEITSLKVERVGGVGGRVRAELDDQLITEDGTDHGAEIGDGHLGRLGVVRTAGAIDDCGGDDRGAVLSVGRILGAECDTVGG